MKICLENKRQTLPKRETVTHVHFNFSKIQQRLSVAGSLEKELKVLLKSQNETKARLLETYQNYKQIFTEVNRLGLFLTHDLFVKGNFNSSESNDKKQSYGIMSSSSVTSPSVKSNMKRPKSSKYIYKQSLYSAWIK